MRALSDILIYLPNMHNEIDEFEFHRCKVSLILCTWNRGISLLRTLNSLSIQRGATRNTFQVVVVDNNSSDNTKDIVLLSKDKWDSGDLVYCFEPRQGKQFALNTGVRNAAYEVIAFSDDDIIFPSNWLECVQRRFSFDNIDLLGGRTLVDWSNFAPPAWYSPALDAVFGGIDLGSKYLSPAPSSFIPAGANMICTKQWIEKVGGFSEAHYRHMDYEFGIRCRRAGGNISYDPNVYVYAPIDARCLNRRYFRRWAFKAGIAADESNVDGASTMSLPRWMYRAAFESGVMAIACYVIGKICNSFKHEFLFWRMAGAISSHWRRRLRPETYTNWVKQHSQKKDNGLF